MPGLEHPQDSDETPDQRVAKYAMEADCAAIPRIISQPNSTAKQRHSTESQPST